MVTINEAFVSPFKGLARSVVENNRGEDLLFCVVHSSLPMEVVANLHSYCNQLGAEFAALRIDEALFGDAPSTTRYPMEVYYRLLAPHVLPASVERILYLDCDTLIINSLKALWEIDLQDKAYAAASHSGEFGTVDVLNQMRLETAGPYFNTGVIVMDLAKARDIVTPQAIQESIDGIGRLIMLPDQDVYNVLCGSNTLLVDDTRWNYDTRRFTKYRAESQGTCDMDWVMNNTAVLHFCGTRKPWKKSYAGRFGSLYKHYMAASERVDGHIFAL